MDSLQVHLLALLGLEAALLVGSSPLHGLEAPLLDLALFGLGRTLFARSLFGRALLL